MIMYHSEKGSKWEYVGENSDADVSPVLGIVFDQILMNAVEHVALIPENQCLVIGFFVHVAFDPARYVLERENYLALCEQIRESLSDYENRIWTLVMSGRTPSEIARFIGADKKSVENAIARVRRKLRKKLPPR